VITVKPTQHQIFYVHVLQLAQKLLLCNVVVAQDHGGKVRIKNIVIIKAIKVLMGYRSKDLVKIVVNSISTLSQ
jgi:uncharacterized protein (DUF302 family)